MRSFAGPDGHLPALCRYPIAGGRGDRPLRLGWTGKSAEGKCSRGRSLVQRTVDAARRRALQPRDGLEFRGREKALDGGEAPQDRASTSGHPATLTQSALLRELRLERFAEGRAAQILHVSPYAAEAAPTIEQLHAFSPPTASSGEAGTTSPTRRPSTRRTRTLEDDHPPARQPASGAEVRLCRTRVSRWTDAPDG